MKALITLAIASFVSLSAFSPVPRQRIEPRGLQLGSLTRLQDVLANAGSYAPNRQCDTEAKCIPSVSRQCMTEVIHLDGEDPLVICSDVVM